MMSNRCCCWCYCYFPHSDSNDALYSNFYRDSGDKDERKLISSEIISNDSLMYLMTMAPVSIPVSIPVTISISLALSAIILSISGLLSTSEHHFQSFQSIKSRGHFLTNDNHKFSSKLYHSNIWSNSVSHMYTLHLTPLAAGAWIPDLYQI